jgi:SPP1 family predicted phage head-tail adaptor
VKAGTLRHLITLQTRDSGTDDAGQPVQTWTQLTQVWADIRGANGLNTIKASLDGVEINAYSFRIRYRTDVDAAKRVVYGGQNYDVKQVRHDHAMREWTDLICEVGGNDG